MKALKILSKGNVSYPDSRTKTEDNISQQLLDMSATDESKQAHTSRGHEDSRGTRIEIATRWTILVDVCKNIHICIFHPPMRLSTRLSTGALPPPSHGD